MVRCSSKNLLFSWTYSTILYLSTVILNPTKSPLPLCAQFGCLTNLESAFGTFTIAFKSKKPTCTGHGFSSVGTDATAPCATHRQALKWMNSIGRPPERKRVPVVLTVPQVQSVLGLMDGVEGTLAKLLYGTVMRLAVMPHALEAKYPRAGQSWAWH